MAFVGTPQCDHGIGQVWMPIYSKVRPKGSRSCGNECTGLEQPFIIYPNEQKVIAKARRHATLEWDRLQGDL